MEKGDERRKRMRCNEATESEGGCEGMQPMCDSESDEEFVGPPQWSDASSEDSGEEMEMEDRCLYFNYGSEQEEDPEGERGSYAATESGDESFKPKDTDDEAGSDSSSEEEVGDKEVGMQESG